MKSRRYMLSLLVMAATVVPLTAQTTESPTGQLVSLITTAATEIFPAVFSTTEVTDRGGLGTCTWLTGAFGPCSACIDGTRTREVYCQCTLDSNEQVRATNENCERDDSSPIPLDSEPCVIPECPPDTPRSPSLSPPPSPVCSWTNGTYSTCSATCEGLQIRTVTCSCRLASGTTTTVPDSVCDNLDPDPRPPASRTCGDEACPDCDWAVEEFSACSATCEGTQVRSVFCQCTLSDGTTTVTSGFGACEGAEPSASQSCGGPCPT
jgi:hypothetical protein